MKRKTSFYFTSIGLLIISTLTILQPTIKVLFHSVREPKLIVSDFSYKNKETNKNIGFEHIKFKQYDFYNSQTNKYEYFLNDYGKEYLIKRFQEATIIGPEISSLKTIVIGDNSTMKKGNLGQYYDVSNSIFIGLFIFLKETKYKLWEDKDSKILQEKRVESILPVIVHEYYHHFFSSYVSSPIGVFSPNRGFLFDLDPIYNIKEITSQIKNKYVHNSIWNIWFYKLFKKMFFEDEPVEQEKREIIKTLKKYIDYSKKLKGEISDKSLKKYLQKVIDAFEEIINKQNQYLYNKIPKIKNIFEWSNKNYPLSLNQNSLDEKSLFLGVVTNYYEKILKGKTYKIPILPVIYSTDYKHLSYIYSIQEQVVRKLLLATFVHTKKYKKMSWNYLHDYLYTSNYLKLPWEKTIENIWKNFYSDNIFPTVISKRNKSKELINDIIAPTMGHNNRNNNDISNLSFITSKNSFDVKSGLLKHESEDIDNDHKRIKIGGFTKRNDFNYIGYKNNDGTIVKFPIQNKKFNIWYKNKIDSKDKIINKNEKYYWYTKNFIDVNKIINKKLFFFKVTKNVNAIEEQAFNSVRKNYFGVANNFNEGMMKNYKFVKKTMNKEANEKGSKWLIVGKKSFDGSIQIKYEEKQEKIEEIWE